MAIKSSTKSVLSLLYVEDDEIMLEIQTSILSTKFPDVMIYTAANGRLGLELFKIHLPDIVITDINMSEMCGDQLSKVIRAIKPETKFIAISGKDSNDIIFEFDHYIVKPIDIKDLFSAIEKCIGGIEKD